MVKFVSASPLATKIYPSRIGLVNRVTKSTASMHPSRFLNVRYWLTWISIGLLRTSSRLPYKLQFGIAKLFGMSMYYLMPRRRHITQVNIALCFPKMEHSAQHELVKNCFRSVSFSIFETALSWWASNQRLAYLCHIDGLENIKNALNKGKGVILLSAHFTSLEIGGRLLSMHHPFTVMYKRHRNPLFNSIMRQAREKNYNIAIQQSDIRGLLRLLKDNKVCWYAPDQDLGRSRSVFAPFMGIPTATLLAPAKIAKLSDAAVVPFFVLRRPDGKGYQLTLYPALEHFPGNDDIENATRINQLIEQQILKAPEQYLWLHRRFKTRPEGDADFYQAG